MPSVVEDSFEIQQLMYRYGHTWDNLDYEGWANVFTEDGVYWEGGGPIVRGRQDLINYASITSPRYSGRFHIVANQLIDVEGDNAKAHSYFTIIDGLTPVLNGSYDDRVVRTPDGWRFAKRTVTCLAPEGFPIESDDMASWIFSPSVGGGWQHRFQWRAAQYISPTR